MANCNMFKSLNLSFLSTVLMTITKYQITETENFQERKYL